MLKKTFCNFLDFFYFLLFTFFDICNFKEEKRGEKGVLVIGVLAGYLVEYSVDRESNDGHFGRAYWTVVLVFYVNRRNVPLYILQRYKLTCIVKVTCSFLR